MKNTRHPLLGKLSEAQVKELVNIESKDPHSILGAHELILEDKSGLVIRAWQPDAVKAILTMKGAAAISMDKLLPGLFAAFIPEAEFPVPAYGFRFTFADGTEIDRADPYRFPPTLGDLDLHLSGQGRHLLQYEKLGAHPMEMDSVKGTAFSVWAPNARRVSLVGPFNGWDGRQLPMRQMGASGIWELFAPGIGRGELYKFEIKTAQGELRIKTDPYAFAMELRPKNASVVWGLSDYPWGDNAWMEQRKTRDLRHSPMAIYEIHLGSWMRSPDDGNRWLTYRELAPRLAAHCNEHGFNFVELCPLAEYAYDPSWGYQVTGYFAPTCRFGDPNDFRYFVDTMHRAGIGVIMDWVPGHFPRDDWALRRFDGTALYEHEDPRQGEHPDWGTLVFNYGRNEVRNFLLSNAMYWLDQFHMDGLRVDAVASMLYLDYSRAPGQWIPNKYGGRENLEAIEFLREFNTELYARFPGAFSVAEESTAFPSVTRPVHLGGLGFGFKWDMGWMNDTLRYMRKEPIHRKYHHNDLTFGMLYAHTENFILPLSHDEVAQGKGSLYDKMPGDHWQKLANLRLLYTWMVTHPGKKLLFMGAEYGQGREWNFDSSLDWHEAAETERSGLQRFVKDLFKLYQRSQALYAKELEPEGFHWIDCNDSDSGVISFQRWGGGREMLVVLHFTPVIRPRYRIGVPRPGIWKELINTDSHIYGGSNVGNGGAIASEDRPHHGHPWSLELTLPPLGGVILQPA